MLEIQEKPAPLVVRGSHWVFLGGNKNDMRSEGYMAFWRQRSSASTLAGMMWPTGSAE